MDLAIGILIILAGLVVSILAFVYIKLKKRFSLAWGGFNLLALSVILISIGVFMIANL
jgi:hypothetical protein